MRKVKDLRKWIAYYDEAERLVEEVALALEYYKEEITTEEEVDDAYGRAIYLFEEVELKNYAPCRGRQPWSRTQDQRWSWRYREPRLGFNACPYV